MKRELNLQPRATIREVWLEPRPGLAMDEAVERAKAAGNTILNVDRNRRRILVAKGS